MAEETVTQSTLAPIADTTPFQPLETIFYGPGESHELFVAQKRIRDIGEKQSSFWPNAIAIGAALKGYMGPLFLLEEQKRKTKLAGQMLPAMAQINKLKNTGQYDAALAATEQLSTNVGPRAPEMIPFFQSVTKDISERQYNWEKVKTWYDTKGAFIQKDHPDYEMAQKVKGAIKHQTPMAWEAIKEAIQDRKHVQTLQGQTIITDPMTGLQSTTPVPETYQTSDFNNYVGINVAQAHGLTVQELTNVMKGIDVKGVSPEKREQIRQDYIALQDINAKLDIAKLIPLEPVISTQMLQSENPLNVAMREVKGRVSDALNEQMNRLTQQKIAETKGTLAVDPRVAAQLGGSFVDIRQGPNFGRPIRGLSFEQGQATPGLMFMTDDQIAKIITPGLNVKDQLALITKMFESAGDMKTPIDKLEFGIAQTISQAAGIPLGKGTTVTAAYQALLARAINEALESKMIDSTEAANLRRYVTGKAPDRAEAVQAMNALTEMIDKRIGRVVGQENVPKTTIPNALPPDMQKIKRDYEQKKLRLK